MQGPLHTCPAFVVCTKLIYTNLANVYLLLHVVDIDLSVFHTI